MTWKAPPLVQAALDEGRIALDALDLYRSFERRYAFPLDEFQVRAITAVLEGSSVIVSAPTGAGEKLLTPRAPRGRSVHSARGLRARVVK